MLHYGNFAFQCAACTGAVSSMGRKRLTWLTLTLAFLTAGLPCAYPPAGKDLIEGWVCIVKERVGGNTAGQRDLYYRTPTGRLIR